MPKVILDLPDDLAQELTRVGDRLPELLRLSLQESVLPNHIYRYILDFLASNPTSEEVVAFRPTLEMTERLKTLLVRSKMGELTSKEQEELDEYERIEHLIILLKAGNLRYLNPPS